VSAMLRPISFWIFGSPSWPSALETAANKEFTPLCQIYAPVHPLA
jgi:hypothetical protein